MSLIFVIVRNIIVVDYPLACVSPVIVIVVYRSAGCGTPSASWLTTSTQR